MKRILCLLLCSCLLPMLHPQLLRAEGEARDSLLALLPQMPHDSIRLKTLVDLTYAFQQHPQEEQIVRWLIDEARLQGDLHRESTGLYMLMLHYYNNDDGTDSLEVWQKRIWQIAQTTGQWKHYFYGKEMIISNYSYQHRYEYAIRMAQEMAQEAAQKRVINGMVAAYYCLANTYRDIHQPEQEYEALQQAYRLFPQVTGNGQKLDVLSSLVKHCADRHRWEEMKRYGDELHGLLLANASSSLGGEAIYSNQLIYTESYLMLYHIHQGEYDTVEHSMKQIRQRINEHTYPPTTDLYLSVCIEYKKAIGAYREALAYSDTILRHKERYAEYNASLGDHLYSRGELLQRIGRYKEAVQCFRQSQQWQDSINDIISNEQIEEIKRVHNLEQILMRQVALREKTQLAILILVSILLVICALYIRHIRHLRKALRQAQQETQEATRQSEKANEVKGLFLSNLRQNIRKPIDTVVKLSQQLAGDSSLNEGDRQRYAQTITENTSQLIRLVNNVLDLSRLEADMTKWQLGPADLVQLSRDALNSAQMHHPDRTFLFESSVEQQRVHTDGKRMMQLLESCLYAISTTDEGPVRLTISKQGGMLHFSIHHSPLADQSADSEERDIRNDINRLTINHFGGEYSFQLQPSGERLLAFTYPISE